MPLMILSKLNDLISWPNLASVGNMPVIRATILAPFLAQIVVNSELYKPLNIFINDVVGYDRLYWLYWSLVSLGIGQLFFNFRCPKTISKYRLQEDYQNIVMLTSTEKELNNIWWKGYMSLFKFKWRGGYLVSSQLTKEELIEKINKNPHTQNLSSDEKDNLTYGLWSLLHRTISYGLPGPPKPIDNWRFTKHIGNYYDLLTKHNPNISTELSITSHISLFEYLKTRQHDQEWKKQAITDKYNYEKMCRPFSRIIISILYTVGLAYFLYMIPKTILTMYTKTISFI